MSKTNPILDLNRDFIDKDSGNRRWRVAEVLKVYGSGRSVSTTVVFWLDDVKREVNL